MTPFDFIPAREFRISLESDYKEMRRCAEAESWKGVHVLAGSIVEALLIESLLNTTDAPDPGKGPLSYDLGQAITQCRAAKILSQRAADLCSVIRSYRNLIHPGRVWRLREKQPDEKSSKIAMALVDIIAEEVADARRTSVGLTAEQLMSKVRRDDQALHILPHLLNDVPENERERLLSTVLPEEYFTLLLVDDPFDSADQDTKTRLSTAFRMVWDSLGEAPRLRVASEFVRILRSEDGVRVREYSAAFVRPEDLESVPEPHRAMVKEHLLTRVQTVNHAADIQINEGIGAYLGPLDAAKWLDPVVKALTAKRTTPALRSRIRQFVGAECFRMSSDVEQAVQKRLDQWISTFEGSAGVDAAERLDLVRELKTEVFEIPF